MPINYIADVNGAPIAVHIPIEEWKRIKARYPDVDSFDNDLPLWQKELIDVRLDIIYHSPDKLKPVEELFTEIDKEE